jgi:hypothetical protein
VVPGRTPSFHFLLKAPRVNLIVGQAEPQLRSETSVTGAGVSHFLLLILLELDGHDDPPCSPVLFPTDPSFIDEGGGHVHIARTRDRSISFSTLVPPARRSSAPKRCPGPRCLLTAVA